MPQFLREEFMSVKLIRRFSVSLAALVLSSGLALAQSKVTLAVGGGSCLCYLPTMLAQALGEYERASICSRLWSTTATLALRLWCLPSILRKSTRSRISPTKRSVSAHPDRRLT